MIQKILLRLWRRRKAVSPVIATILLIALTVTAAAIVYFVVVPLLRGTPELIMIEYELKDTDASDLADELTMTIKNIGGADANLATITVIRNEEAANWEFEETDPVVIVQAQETDVVFLASSTADEFGYTELVEIVVTYDSGKDITLTIKIPATFSRYVLIYEEDFEGTLDIANWEQTLFLTHGGGTHTLDDWIVQEQSGNHYWHCTNNDCQFIVLADPLHKFADVNTSYDLRTNDDDANGIIFRYDDSGLYPKFYIIWFTGNHPGPNNGPFAGEADDFDWATAGDQISENKVTLHYVEGDADGFNWYK
ncbi:MAG: archaellin/type IV pilin N-terminal domain-containing protein, partial [Candidatus Heimdallarchaeota archaeon]